MSISQVLVILLRRGWIILLTLLTAMIAAGSVLFFVPGRYDAVATASIDPGSVDPISQTVSGGGMIGLMQGNIMELVTSQRVAVDVVKRLNLTANPQVQESFRQSGSFGRESIEEWMASSLVKNVDPKFNMGTDVLAIKYKSSDPNQAALIANAFLASTIDGSVAMKIASADQTARWFAPQIEELRKDVETARAALEAFQAQTNMVATNTGGDSETSQYMAISSQLSAARAEANTLQSRLASGSTDLSNDPSDPDLQVLASLKEKLSSSQSTIEAAKGTHRPEQSEDDGGTGKPCLGSKAARRRDGEDAAASERAHRDDAEPDRFPYDRASAGAKNADRRAGPALPYGGIAARRRLPLRATQRARKSVGGDKAQDQADVFGYDCPRQGSAAASAGFSETTNRDSAWDRRRAHARPIACAARGGDRPQGPLSD